MCFHAHTQVVDLIQEPIGIALYEMKDGQISNVCIQGGLPVAALNLNKPLRQDSALRCTLVATCNGGWSWQVYLATCRTKGRGWS